MMLASLPRKPQHKGPDQKIHFLGVASLPQKVEETLKLGPKFATHPNLDKLELLSLVRTTVSKASAEDEERCIHEGVDVLPPSGIRSSRTRNVVRELRATNTKLLLSDKEGGFAAASESVYKARADLAISGNFREIVRAKPDRKKKEAIQMCERWGLSNLASTLKKSKGATLQVFFSAKTHKEGCPFRAIVTERGSWQRALGRFLQAPLARLGVDDPFLVRSSCEVSDFFLESQSAKTLDAFSIDIKDLYYNLPRGSVLKAVSDAVDQFGNVGFQSECEISTGKFLEALNFYLDSTYVEYSGSLYLQKEGVCIGSSLAPVLSDLLLASLDRQLQMALEGKSVVKTFRYVDDYLVVFKKKCGAEAEQKGLFVEPYVSWT
ncbi:uncharacterized protein LOC144168506 [Haemaphysalis longicornis]